MSGMDKFSAGTGQTMKGSQNPEKPKKGVIDAAIQKSNSDVKNPKKGA